jgi:SAM-dependent methyltransferase
VLGLARNFERYDDQLQKTNAANSERDNRIANLTREIRQLGAKFDAGLLGTVSTAPLHSQISSELPRLVQEIAQVKTVPGLDNFYVEFEDNFRGTPEDIVKRLRVYLPYLEKFKNNPAAIVVDVGCGRGEWLSLLSANHIAGIGVDMNATMIEACKDKGFNAHCADAIDYLRAQPENSVAVVTGFHIIEHLPFETLLALFDAALYALRSDGLIIFETPNPENVVVGACNFYFDPTHRNPIVPVVAEFMAKQRGFARAEILRLHPYPDHHRIAEESELAKRFNAAFYGPQDFAIVAWKNHAN